MVPSRLQGGESDLTWAGRGGDQLAGAGSNEIRNLIPIAAANRPSVRVDGFSRPLPERAIAACVVCARYSPVLSLG